MWRKWLACAALAFLTLASAEEILQHGHHGGNVKLIPPLKSRDMIGDLLQKEVISWGHLILWFFLSSLPACSPGSARMPSTRFWHELICAPTDCRASNSTGLSGAGVYTRRRTWRSPRPLCPCSPQGLARLHEVSAYTLDARPLEKPARGFARPAEGPFS